MTDNFYLYAAGAAALAAAFFFWTRGRRAVEEAPSQGSRFAAFGEEVRLRDLYKLAILVEKEGRAFYLAFAAAASNPDAKRLCLALAAEEEKHREFFEGRLNKWRPLGVNVATWPAVLEKVRKEGLFGEPPRSGADERELAAFAIRQEAKTAAFYSMFEEAFPKAWKREELLRIVAEEKSHEARLRAAYPGLKPYLNAQ